MSQAVLNHALRYAAKGWSVIPLLPRSKRPAIDWAPFQSRRASREELLAWFSSGDNNLGVVTGAISGIISIDLDGPSGISTARENGLTSPCSFRSGRAEGGRQLIFRHPGSTFQNGVKVLPGIDTRGDGGYFVAPPSIHPETSRIYRWELEYVPGVIPAGILTRLAAKTTERVKLPDAVKGMGVGNRHVNLTRIIGRLVWDKHPWDSVLALLTPMLEKMQEQGCAEDPFVHAERIYRSFAGKDAAKPTVKLETTTSAMSLDALLGIPAPKFIIPGAIAEGSITAVVGRQKTGKSTLLADIAADLASEEANTIFGKSDRPRSVLYIDEENADVLQADRLRRMLTHKTSVRRDLFHIAIRKGTSLLDPAGLAKLRSLIIETAPEVIFLDSFQQFLGGAADFDNSRVNQALNVNLRGLMAEFGFSAFVLHHENKGSYKSDREGEEVTAEHSRGGTAFAAAVDSVYVIRRRGEDVTLYNTDARWTKASPPIEYRVEEESLRLVRRSDENSL